MYIKNTELCFIFAQHYTLLCNRFATNTSIIHPISCIQDNTWIFPHERLVIDAARSAKSFEEAIKLVNNAAQIVFRDACSTPDLYEQLAIGRTTLAAACHDFDDNETFAISHTQHYLHEGSFYKVHPLNPKANEIAENVALDARRQLCLERMAYAAASNYAGKRETGIQADVLARLLTICAPL